MCENEKPFQIVAGHFCATLERVSDVTRILEAAQQGDPTAAGQLLPLVYEELRRLAAHKMANEAAGHTLQPTALVHEGPVTSATRHPAGARAGSSFAWTRATPIGGGSSPVLPVRFPRATQPAPLHVSDGG